MNGIISKRIYKPIYAFQDSKNATKFLQTKLYNFLFVLQQLFWWYEIYPLGPMKHMCPMKVYYYKATSAKIKFNSFETLNG